MTQPKNAGPLSINWIHSNLKGSFEFGLRAERKMQVFTLIRCCNRLLVVWSPCVLHSALIEAGAELVTLAHDFQQTLPLGQRSDFDSKTMSCPEVLVLVGLNVLS